MQVEHIPTIKALVHRLKSDPIFKRSLGFEYISKTPSAATFTRFINKLSETDILERTYRRMIYKAHSLGLIDATNVAIDASKINAFEHAIPLKKFLKMMQLFLTGEVNLTPMVTLLNGLVGKCMH